MPEQMNVMSIQGITANTTTSIGSTVVNGYIRDIYTIRYSNPNATAAHVTIGTSSGRIIDDDMIASLSSDFVKNSGPIANNKPGEQLYVYANTSITIVMWYKDVPGSL